MRKRFFRLLPAAFLAAVLLTGCGSGPTDDAGRDDAKIIEDAAPGAPQDITAVSTEAGVLVRWQPVEDADSYRVYRRTADSAWVGLATVDALEYVDGTAMLENIYLYTVRAFRGEAISAYEPPGVKCSYWLELDAPALLSVEGRFDGLALVWTAIPGAECYRVCRRAPGGDWEELAQVEPARYTDTGAELGESYEYRVSACNQGVAEEMTSGTTAARYVFSRRTLLLAAAIVLSLAGTGALAWARGRKVWAALPLLTVLWALCVCCGDTHDLTVLRYAYELYPRYVEPHAWGFDLLFYGMAAAGFGFRAFQAVAAAFSLTLVYLALRRLTDRPGPALCLFVLFPFVSFIAQLRNGMMAAVILYSLAVFIRDPRHRLWKYLLGVALACLIHPSAVFFLIFALAKPARCQSRRLTVALAAVILAAVTALIGTNVLYDLLRRIISNTRILDYLNFDRVRAATSLATYNLRYRALIVGGHGLGFLLYCLAAWQYRRNLRGAGERLPLRAIDGESLEMMTRMEIYLLCILPAYMLNPTYFRIFKDVTPLIYALGAQNLALSQAGFGKRRDARLLLAAMAACALLASAMTDYAMGGTLKLLESFSLTDPGVYG